MPSNFEDKTYSPGRVVFFKEHLNQRAENRGALGDFSSALPKASPASYPTPPSTEAAELRPSRQRSAENNESTIFPYIPRKRQERIGLLIDYLYLPASHEAGDQVDFLILGENRVGILLADVHGKIPEDSTPVLKTVLRSNSTGLSVNSRSFAMMASWSAANLLSMSTTPSSATSTEQLPDCPLRIM